MKNKVFFLEILFSIIIIALIIFIITILFLEVKVYKNIIIYKSDAANIASSILENMKSRNFDDIQKYIDEISSIGVSKKIEENIQRIIVTGSQFEGNFFGTKIPEKFDVEVKVTNYNSDFFLSKDVTIIISEIINGRKEETEYCTKIERENIREYNYPIIGEKYFKNLVFNEYNIVPIKYSTETNSYITTNENDNEWFDYNVKKWAKVLVFSKDNDNLEKLFISEDGVVKNIANYDGINLNITDYIYTWIPNFSEKDNVTYFRYKASKKSIKLDILYNNGKYLYLNKISDEIRDISENCSFDGVEGVWRKYNEIEDEYYSKFNSSKYGPVNIF